MKGLALILGSRPKGGKAPREFPRPGAKEAYLDEVKDAFKSKDEDAFTAALEGYVRACVEDAKG